MRARNHSIIAIALLLLFGEGGLCFAVDYSDKALYAAYLDRNLQLWDDYIHSVCWEKASTAERLRLLNYEYGYTAVALDQKKDDTADHLACFEKHIADLNSVLPTAEKYVYQSAACVYRFGLSRINLKSGVRALSLADEAIKADSLCALAQALKGNTFFYCPKALGGNKEKALNYYMRALSLYESQPETLRYKWNYRAVQRTVVQCLQKQGRIAEALALARSLLAQEPTWAYVRDVLIPELEKASK